jgi:hypothetical protein
MFSSRGRTAVSTKLDEPLRRNFMLDNKHYETGMYIDFLISGFPVCLGNRCRFNGH